MRETQVFRMPFLHYFRMVVALGLRFRMRGGLSHDL